MIKGKPPEFPKASLRVFGIPKSLWVWLQVFNFL